MGDYSEKILRFLGLGLNQRVLRFLASHTSTDIGGAASTYRNSKRTPFLWMKQLPFEEVESIQNKCFNAMQLWGYNLANNETEYKNLNPVKMFDLDNTDISIEPYQ